jgi:hypothetical protein
MIVGHKAIVALTPFLLLHETTADRHARSYGQTTLHRLTAAVTR